MDDEVFNRSYRNMLSPYGVRPDEFSARYDDDLRDFDIAISSGPLSGEQVETIWHVLPRGSHVTFADSVNAQAWTQLGDRIARIMVRARSQTVRRQLADLPIFDAALGDLAAYAREAEHYCGYEPGSVVEVRGSTILLKPRDIGASFVKLADVLAAGTMDAEGVRIATVGSIAD